MESVTENGEVFLQTERVVLKEMTMDQVDHLVELDSDPEVMHFITDGEPRPREHHLAAIPKLLKYAEENPGLGLWTAYQKDTKEFMGWYILKHLLETGEVEIGFRLRKKFWGHGYSTEVSKAIVNHGFVAVGLNRIIAITRPDNLASQAVIKKIGLKEEGTGMFYGIHCLYFGLNRSD
ncbi:MAG: RimJ/RimL family protein N-acetyltransferase [Granulosicoccus sp.]|jgi:RimJ/RimL family protein N-acetyltransferase